MVEPELLLMMPVRLFTDPSGFDRGGEPLEGGVGRQVRNIDIVRPVPLSCRSFSNSEPAANRGFTPYWR